MFDGGINYIVHYKTYRAICSLNTSFNVLEKSLLGDSTYLDNAIFSFSYEIFNKCENLLRKK